MNTSLSRQKSFPLQYIKTRETLIHLFILANAHLQSLFNRHLLSSHCAEGHKDRELRKLHACPQGTCTLTLESVGMRTAPGQGRTGSCIRGLLSVIIFRCI